MKFFPSFSSSSSSSFSFLSTTFLLFFLIGTAVLNNVFVQEVNAQTPTTFYGYISNNPASPMRTASWYYFGTNNVSGTSALGTIYVFRQGSKINDTVITNQRPVLSNTGDVRRVYIVEVPSGAVAAELTTFNEVTFAGLTIHSTNLFAIAPLTPINFTYASTAHSTAYPNTTCLLETGTASAYLDFGYLESGLDVSSSKVSTTSGVSTSVLYQQYASGTGTFLGSLIDSVPGDHTYSPLRIIYTVRVSGLKTKLSDLTSAIPTQTIQWVITAVVDVVGVDVAAPFAQAATTGYSAGNKLRVLSFNQSRMGSMITDPKNGMKFAKVYRIPNQTELVLEYAPGESGYSDMLAIVDVTFAANTLVTSDGVVFNSKTSIPSNASFSFTGRYINCPVLHASSTWSSSVNTDRVPPSAVTLYYQGGTKTCFNFSYVEAGCALRRRFELVRTDFSVVADNDMFPEPAESSLKASPFTWKFPYSVAQGYFTGTLASMSQLDSSKVSAISAASYTAGEFVNTAFVSRPAMPAPGGSYTNIGTTSSRSTGLNNWTLRYWAPAETMWSQENQVCFELTSQFGHSAVTIGFGQSASASDTTTTSSSSSSSSSLFSIQHSTSTIFITAHFTNTSTSCFRALVKNTATGSFTNVDATTMLNLTHKSFSLTEDSNAVRLQFCRNRYPTLTSLSTATVGVLGTAVERIEVASGPVRTSPSSVTNALSDVSKLPETCTTTLDTSLWATVTRFAVDWTNYLPNTVLSPAFTTSTTTTGSPLATTTTSTAPNTLTSVSSGEGQYRLDEDKVLSWQTLPAGQLNPTHVQFFLTFNKDFYGWMALGFGALTFVQSDILFVLRTPSLVGSSTTSAISSLGGLVFDDRKGITTSLYRLDSQQDWSLGNAASVNAGIPSLINNSMTLAFTRKLDTGDRGISTQSVAHTQLVGSVIRRGTGFGGGFPIEYYEFENTAASGASFTSNNFTESGIYYKMINGTTATDITWQHDLIDVMPGQAGYSDLWRVVTITVPENFIGPEITSVSEIPSNWNRTTVPSTAAQPYQNMAYWLNCPVTHRITTVDSTVAAAVTSVRDLWYRGSQTRCIELGRPWNARLYTAQKGVRLMRAGTNTTLDILLEYAPTTDNTTFAVSTPAAAPINDLFSPFVLLSTAYVPAGALYTSGFYKSYGEFIKGSSIPISTTSTSYVHLPAILPGSPVTAGGTGDGSGGGSATPSPPGSPGGGTSTSFTASLTSGYDKTATLQTTANTRVDVYWKLLPDTSTGPAVKFMVLGYNIFGYLSLGFSDSNYEKMQAADMMIGIRASISTLKPCVKALYSDAKTGSPTDASTIATLMHRNPIIGHEAAGMYFGFERDYHAQAHTTGRIPASPPIIRLLWASLEATTSVACTTPLDFLSLYHSSSPHGSVMVNLETGVIGSTSSVTTTTVAPGSFTPSPRSAVLRPLSLARQTIKYRDWDIPAYCAPTVYNDDSNLIIENWVPLFPEMTDLINPDLTPDYANITFDEAFSSSSTAPATMYFFFALFNGSSTLTELQHPLVNHFIGSKIYTGVFRAVFLTVDTQGMNQTQFSWTAIQSMQAARTSLSATNFTRIALSLPEHIDLSSSTAASSATTSQISFGYCNMNPFADRDAEVTRVKTLFKDRKLDLRQWINCPAVHSSTSVESQDNSRFPKFLVYSEGWNPACMFMGSGHPNDIGNGEQVHRPPLTFSTTTTSTNSNKRIYNASEVLHEAWNITESILSNVGSGSATSSLIVDSLRFPLFQVVHRRHTATGSVQSAETVESLTTGNLGTDTFINGSVAIVNCVPLLEKNITRPTTPKTMQTVDTGTATQVAYFENRAATIVMFESTQRSANRYEADVGLLYMMLRGGATVGLYDRASDHPSFVSNSKPGTITEAVIFRVIGVDVGTRNSTALGPYTNVSQLSALPQEMTDTYMQCTFVPQSTFVGASSSVPIPLEVVYVDSTKYFCSNFGATRWPKPETQNLTAIYQLFSPGGTILLNNNLVENVPGRPNFFGLMWVVQAKLFTTPSSSNPIRSLSTLDGMRTIITNPWRIMSVFVINVNAGTSTSATVRELVVSTSPTTGAPIIARNVDTRVDPTSMMAGRVEFHPERGIRSSSTTDGFPIANRSTYNETHMLATSLPRVYFFRRGPTLESPIVESQQSIVSALPGQTSYSAATGFGGYADLFRVVVVVVPTNITSVTIYKSQTEVLNAISTAGNGIYSVVTDTVAALFVAAKSPNSTVDASKVFASAFLGQQQSCAGISVWGESNLIASMLCGFSTSLTSTVVNQDSQMTSTSFVLAPFTFRGWTFVVAARLDVANPFIQEDFSVNPLSPAFTNKHLASAAVIGSSSATLPNNETAVLGKKYIFRNGPHLYGSEKISALLPVMDRTISSSASTTYRAQAYELVVVNVEGSIWRNTNTSKTASEVLAGLQITRAADIWLYVESQCWVIRPTGIIESGPLVPTTTTIPTSISSTKIERVYSEGIVVQHFVLAEALKQNVDFPNGQYAVGVFSGQTIVSFLFPYLPSVRVIADRFSLYRVVRIALEDLDSAKISRSQVASATSVESLAALFNVSSSVSPTPSSTSVAENTYVTYSTLEQAISSTVLSNVTRGNTSLWSTMHMTQVAARPFVSPLLQKSWLRDQFYVDGSATIGYRFHALTSLTPVPLYVFVAVDAFGRRLTAAAPPILVHLPGDTLYTDVHERVECVVDGSTTAGQSWVPLSAADVGDALQSGLVKSCSSIGLFAYVVMNASSTIESEDIFNSLSNPRGFQFFTAYHDGSSYKVYVPGPLLPQEKFSATTLQHMDNLSSNGFILADLYNGETSTTPVARGSILSTAVPSSSYGELYRVCNCYALSSSNLPFSAGSVKNYSELTARVTAGTAIINCTNEAVLVAPTPQLITTTSATSSLIFDDYVFAPANGLMPVQWAFGQLAGPSPSLSVTQPPAAGGAIKIDIFTGNTDEPALGDTTINSATSATLGTYADFEWKLTPIGAPTSSSSSSSSSSRRWGDFPTYQASEHYVDLTFNVKSDAWIAIAFVSSDRAYSDVYLNYIGNPLLSSDAKTPLQYQQEGYYGSKTFVVHQKAVRRPTVNGTVPQYYHLRSYNYNGNTSTSSATTYLWQSTTTRALVNSDLTTVDLSKGEVTVLWAAGTWDSSTSLPSTTLQRGVFVVDFVNGNWIKLDRGLPPAWVIITVLLMGAMWVLVGLLANNLTFSRLLYSRPLLSCCCCDDPTELRNASGFTWFFIGATLGNLLSMLWWVLMLTIWSLGATFDAQGWRSSNPSVIAIFRALQFCMYFILFPLPRHNLLFLTFGISTNRGQRWQTGILLTTFITSVVWVVVAGITGMISSITDIVCSSILSGALFYWFLLESGSGRSKATTWYPTFMIRRELRIPQRCVLILGVVICILLIEFTTLYGMLLSMILLLLDVILWFRDMKGRTGFVRSAHVFNHDSRSTVALELMMSSDPRPEYSWSMSQFDVVRPGSFGLVQFDDFGSATSSSIPLVLSAIQQEQEIAFAATAVHLRCSIFDIACAAVPGIPAERSSSFSEMVLRAADEQSLVDRPVTIYGPFGGMEHTTGSNYGTLVLIAGGSGIVSTMSVLENLCLNSDFSRTTTVRLIEFIWVLKDAEEIEAWRVEFKSVLQAVRQFQVHFAFYLTGSDDEQQGKSGVKNNSNSSPNRQLDFDDINDMYDERGGEEMKNKNKKNNKTPNANMAAAAAAGGDVSHNNNNNNNSKVTQSQQEIEANRKKQQKYLASFYDEEDEDGGEANSPAEGGGGSPPSSSSSSSKQQQNTPNKTPSGGNNNKHDNSNISKFRSPGPENISTVEDGIAEEIAGGLSETEASWSEVADLYRGRPVWENLLYQIKIDASMRTEDAVAVFVSAPRNMSRHLMFAGEQVSDWGVGTVLHVEVEKFDEW